MNTEEMDEITEHKYKHNNKKIEVLDAIMGSGKTKGIIRWMNENPNKKYLYVSPLLTEVEDRIVNECASLGFVSPNTEEHNTKSDHLLELLSNGHNVAFTHNLFTEMKRDHLKHIDNWGYTLIIDEEIDFINAYTGRDYKSTDILTLEKSGHVRIDEENLGRVVWTWEEDKFIKDSAYTRLKNMCELEMLHCSKRREMMVTHLPIALITVAERVIVLTYLFKGSVMDRFMQMKGIQTEPFTGATLEKTEAEVKSSAEKLITIFKTPSTKKVSRLALSSNWYDNAKSEELKRVQSALRSACNKGHRDDVMYTLKKELVEPSNKKSKPKIRVNGYHPKDCFVSCAIKATNDYDTKSVLIHGFNRYPSLTVSSYLTDYGFPIKDDEFALSECIQWIWRSRIRKGKSIQLCFLSPRMERIFRAWMDGQEVSLE